MFQRITKITLLVSFLLLCLSSIRAYFFPQIFQFMAWISELWYIWVFMISAGVLLFFNKQTLQTQIQSLEKKESGFSYWYIAWLLMICIVSFWIKFPYMEMPFSQVYQSAKYTSYLEPAKAMVDKGPFYFKRDYLRMTSWDPFKTDLSYKTFSAYPILEWTIAWVSRLFPFSSWEFIVRFVMATLWVVLLLSFSVFLRNFLTRAQTLFVVALFGLSSLFHFFTSLTVLDPINLIFLFWAWHLLIRGILTKNIPLLYIAWVLAGIGINIKYNALVFYVPLFLFIIYGYTKLSHEEKISYVFLIFPNFVLQTVFFWFTVRYLPSNLALYGSLTLVMIGIQWRMYRKSFLIYNSILYLINKIGVRNFYISAFIFIVVFLVVLFQLPQFIKIKDNFLTDSYLLFDWKMYKSLFLLWYSLATPFLTISSLVVCLLAQFWFFSKKHRLLINMFFVTALFYSILISKALYTHIYYYHINVLAVTIIGAMLLFFLLWFIRHTIIKYALLLLFLWYIYIYHIDRIQYDLWTYNPVIPKLWFYLKSHLHWNETFIHHKWMPEQLMLYTDKMPFLFVDSVKKQFTQDAGAGMSWTGIVQKYHIKYFVSCPNGDFNMQWIYDIFHWWEKVSSFKELPLRTRRILCVENNMFCDTLDEVRNIQTPSKEVLDFFEKKIWPYFVLETKIDECGVYRLTK